MRSAHISPLFSLFLVAFGAAVVGACATGLDPEGPNASSGAGGAGDGGGAPIPSGGGSVTAGSGGASGGVNPTTGGAGGPLAAGGALSGGGPAVEAGPPPPVPIGDLAVQYETRDEVADNELKPHLAIVNRGTTAVPLALLTMRYWYTADGSPSGTDYQELNVDYADIGRITNGGTSVKLSFAQVMPAEVGADHYIEVGFVGGDSLGAGQSTNQIEIRINWRGHTTNYDETNDYSWDGTKSSFTDSHTVTLYQSGVLIWGREPDGTEPQVPMDDAGLPPPSDAGMDPGDAAAEASPGR
jgi:hypothetical protein